MTEIINDVPLGIKEYKGKRVVTFKDIDAVHQRPDGTARRNFTKNRKHFIEDVDFFKVKCKEVWTFFVQTPNGFNPDADIILVTESGYLMIVKSFKDDLAWSVQRKLVNGYFQAQKCIECPAWEELDYINSNINSLRTEIRDNLLTNRKFFPIINEGTLKKQDFSPYYEKELINMSEKLTGGGARVPLSQLKTGRIWTNWVWYTKKDGKRTKKPLSKVNEPNTWITYADAENYAEWDENKGIGIMFAKNNRSGLALCGIDIDAHNVDNNPLAKEIMEMFSDTYIERSPSGKGYHIIFFAKLENLPPTKEEYEKLYKQKNSKLDIECYISGITNRYFTFTGQQTSEGDYVTDKTDTLLEFLEKYMKVSLSSPVSLDNQLKLTEEGESTTTTIDVNSRLEIAMNASNGNLFKTLYNGDISGYGSHSEAVQAFMNMLVFYFGDGGESLVKDVFMRSGMAYDKWSERDTIINSTISNAFKRVPERYTPQQARHQNSRTKNKLTGGEGENSESDKKKKPMINYDLFAEFIEKLGYSIRYNQISHDFEFFGFDKRESIEHLAENVPTILQDILSEHFTRISKQRIIDYITRYATRHKYNPVLSAIQAVKWDGKDRISQIYEIFKIPADTEEGIYSRAFIFKWLLQCVCGLFNNIENPFSLDIILVFQGKQGIGKTRFFEMLALSSKYFGEGICLDPRDKDSIIQATSKWISELGELGSTMRKDMDSVKAFLTKSTDEYRTPYGKASLHYPRITSFVGTVNDEQFLIDQTGNRRFATIPLPLDLVIDYETQIKPFNALQLWAQVYELVKDKNKASCFRFSEEEKRYLEKRNSSYLKPMKGEYEVLDILEEQQMPQQGYICTFKEMTVLQFIQKHNLKYDANVVGRVLRKYGYESKVKKENGKSTRVIKLPIKYWSGNK